MQTRPTTTQPTRSPASEAGYQAGQTIGGLFVVFLLLTPVFLVLGIVLFVRSSKRKTEGRAAAAQEQAASQAWQAEQQRQAWQVQQYQAEQHRQAQEHAAFIAREQAEQARAAAAAEAERQARLASLTSRFGAANAPRIMAGEFWVGQTRAMLIESLGYPADTDEKVLKTKTKETFKYNSMGVNRYRLRVFLDDGVVVGWEDKG